MSPHMNGESYPKLIPGNISYILGRQSAQIEAIQSRIQRLEEGHDHIQRAGGRKRHPFPWHRMLPMAYAGIMLLLVIAGKMPWLQALQMLIGRG